MPHVVPGVLKSYAWGVTDGLARWCGATGAPQAELWFGAHPAGPSEVLTGPDAGRSLAELDEHRGVPLVKLLCAGSPLSIQVHPDEARAREGWSSGSIHFCDDAEKSEVLVALEPFDVHAGWRDPDEAADVLAAAGAPIGVVVAARSGDPVSAARLLLALDPQAREVLEARIADAARRCEWPADAVTALERVLATYPGDGGTLVTVLLHHAHLRPGDAVAVPAGVVHSYVAGLAAEVMTSSDNVLRLGLTSKPIAVDEALAAVHVERRPEWIPAGAQRPVAPVGMPFDVDVVSGPRTLDTGRHRVVLALEGDVLLPDDRVAEGCAAVWAPGEAEATITAQGRAIVVTASHAGGMP
jgi:mannose-6-phosphate isomerase